MGKLPAHRQDVLKWAALSTPLSRVSSANRKDAWDWGVRKRKIDGLESSFQFAIESKFLRH